MTRKVVGLFLVGVMVNSPENTIAMSAGDIPTLRAAGAPEPVITAIWGDVPASAPVPLQPGGSQTDSQTDAQESTIEAWMATHAGSPATLATVPPRLVFDNLVLMKMGLWGFLKENREGRLVIRGDTLGWEDRRDSEESFEFHTTGLEKVWFTCDARASEDFCYQINFKIAQGDSHRFLDDHHESGSNAAVLRVMEALRMYFPRLAFGTSDD